MNICGSSERYLAVREPLPWLLYYLFVAFFLFLSANWVGVSDASFDAHQFHKKIGLYYSVNWTITFLVLYPIFLFLAIRGTGAIRNLWLGLVEQRLIFVEKKPVEEPASFLNEWDLDLARWNSVAILFIVICVAIGGTDFYETAAGPLWACDISFADTGSSFAAPIDWSTIAIVNHACNGHRLSLLALSAALYFLMTISLIFYLVFLFYSTYVFGFLAKVSRPDGQNRFVFRPMKLQGILAPTVENFMMCVVLGLSVCALMQAHFAYLRSSVSDPAAFLTSDIQNLAHQIAGYLGYKAAPSSGDGGGDFVRYQEGVVSKGLVLLPLVVTIIGCGIGGIAELYDSVRNSLFYTQDKLRDVAWTKGAGITEAEVASIQGMNQFGAFVAVIPPYGFVYVIICALLVLSIVLSSFFIFLCSAVVIFMHRLVSKYLLPKSRGGGTPIFQD